jgi:hypothetical protein
MKKLLFISVLILGASSANAKPYKNREEGGFKFGTKSALGFLYEDFSLFLEKKVNQKLSVESGLLFGQHIYAIEAPEGGHKLAVNPLYLSIPLTLRLYPGKDRQSSLFLGVQVGYLVGGSILGVVDKPEDLVNKYSVFTEENGSVKLTNFSDRKKAGLTLALGYSYEFKIGLILGTNFTHVFNPVFKTDNKVSVLLPNLDLGWNLTKVFN